jgi:hypothetical protein
MNRAHQVRRFRQHARGPQEVIEIGAARLHLGGQAAVEHGEAPLAQESCQWIAHDGRLTSSPAAGRTAAPLGRNNK